MFGVWWFEYVGRLVAQDVQSHHASKRVRNQMDSAIVFEAWVVTAPQAVDTIGFLDNGFNHLRFVIREIVWNIEHDIADKIPYGWDGVCGNVTKGETVRQVVRLARRFRRWFRTNIVESQPRTPVDLSVY